MLKRHDGFTFVELVIVISLIVMITGLATVRFMKSYEGRSSEQLTKELTTYLRYLQFRAIEEGLVHKLESTDDDKGLVAYEQGEKWDKFSEIQTPFSKRLSQFHEFSVDFQNGDVIYFFPDGSMTKNKLWIVRGTEREETLEIKNRIGSFNVNFEKR